MRGRTSGVCRSVGAGGSMPAWLEDLRFPLTEAGALLPLVVVPGSSRARLRSGVAYRSAGRRVRVSRPLVDFDGVRCGTGPEHGKMFMS